MATKVNRKLLFVVVAGVTVAVVTVGGILVLQYRADATRHIRRGDAALAEGDAKAAVSYYGRAIGKKPNNTDYYTKFLGAVQKIVPATAEEARERYQQYMASLTKRAQAGRNDPQFWNPVFEEFRLQAAVTDAPANWQLLASICDDAMAVLPTDDPLVTDFTAMREYANARRVRGLAPEEIRKSEESLAAIKAAVRGEFRDLAYAAILRFQFDRARRLDGSGQSNLSQQALADFDRTLAEAKSGEFANEVLSIEITRLATDPVANAATIQQSTEELARMVLASDNRRAVLDAVKAVAGSGSADSMRKAADMLETYLERHPESIIHRRAYAFCLQSLDPASSEAEARKVLDTPRMGVALESAAQQDVRVLASQQLFDAEFARISQLTDPAEVKEGITRLEKARDRIAEEIRGAADDSSLLKAEGKLNLARKDAGQALVKFNEIIKRATLQDLDLYTSATVAALETRQLGLALQYVDRGLEISGGNPVLLEMKGQIELEVGRFPQAAATAQTLLLRYPDRPKARRMLELAQAGMKGAVALDDKDPVIVAMKTAEERFQRKDVEGARAALIPLIEKYPSDVRVFRTLAQLEASAENAPKVIEYAEAGLVLVPNDPFLVRLKAFAQSDDPVTRILAMVQEVHKTEPETTVFAYIRLTESSKAMAAEAASRDPASAESKRLVAGAEASKAAAAEWKAKAMAAAPGHPAIVEFEFSQALTDKDFATAETIVNEAERGSREPALPPTLRARLQLERGDPRSAIATLRRSIEGNVDSAEIWRLLGYSHDQVGELAEAIRAFQAAYDRRPTDIATIRLYVPTLAKAGDRGKALELLREARRIAPNDEDINDLWLGLESEIGDRRLARTIREARLRILPDERRNALALAQMYARTAPDRLDVIFEGKAKYTEAEWRAVGDEVRDRELNRVQKEWFERSDKIYRDAIKSDPTSLELSLSYAAIMRQQGRDKEAEKVVSDVIAAAGDKVNAGMWIAVGVNRRESGDVAGSDQAFAEAVRIQDDSKRDAEIAIGEYHFQRSEWAAASDRYERALERQNARPLTLRAAEANIKCRRFDRARQLVQAATAMEGGRDTVIAMLEANLEESEGDVLLEAGKNPEAEQAYAKANGMLDGIIATVPLSAKHVILTQQANVYRKRFLAVGGEENLDKALASADQAVATRGDYWPAADSRFETLAGRGDIPGALAELERYVKAVPSHFPSRQKLLRTLMGMGNPSQAAEVVNQAIELFPTSADWRIALADVELLRGRPEAAVAALVEADRLSPDTSILSRATEMQMRISKPNWEGLIKILRDRGDEVRASPFLQTCLGVCLMKTDDPRRGVESIREGFLRASKTAEAGDGSDLDSVYRALFILYPPDRTPELESLVSGFRSGNLLVRDWRWIGDHYLSRGESGYRESIVAFGKAVAADDGKDAILSAGVLNGLGSAQYLGGDCAAALASFEKAAEKDATDPAILNNLAYLCGECGSDAKRGVGYAVRAVRLAPTVADYYDTLGSLLYLTGDDKNALDVLLRSLKFRSTASANFHVAQVLQRQGRKDEARNYLRTALELQPISSLQAKINALMAELN